MFTKILCVQSVFLFLEYAAVLGYKGAVLEYTPSYIQDNPRDTILKNIDLYATFVAEAKRQGVQIVVFPEYGLTGLVQTPGQYAVEVKPSEEIIFRLSHIADEHDIYLVVNLLEKEVQNSSIRYYNCDVVIHRNGSILAKYRKINLFEEPNLSAGNEIVTFETDFGTTFGILSGHDILFNHPGRDILKKNVTDIVYTAAWKSTMPFYTALDVQHGYAKDTGVNLLAANYDDPQRGRGGSGLYASGITELYLDSTTSSRMKILDLPLVTKKDQQSCIAVSPRGLIAPRGFPGLDNKANITAFITGKDFNSKQYKFQDLDVTESTTYTSVVHGSTNCIFNISIRQPANNNEVYKLMAFEGTANVGGVNSHVRTCSLLACKNSMVDSCGERVNGTTYFESIMIVANLPLFEDSFYQPTTLNYNLQPIVDSNYCNNPLEYQNRTNIQLVSTRPHQGVLVFGLFGVGHASSSTGIQLSGLILVLVALKVFIFDC